MSEAAALKEAQLLTLAHEIEQNNVSPELRAQAIQLVMGSGNANADIVLIGEAPGKKEDEQGKPFIGASGRFLDAMLEAAGLDREDVYITNIVKYRPPNNRDPKPEEKAEFLPYLLKQLDIIQPKTVITLGRHSMEYFLPGVSISDIHGQSQKVIVQGRELTIAPLYHPAAALYNGGMRQTLIDDFVKIAEEL